MDDVRAGEVVGGGYFGGAGRAAVEGDAFSVEAWACGGVDRAVLLKSLSWGVGVKSYGCGRWGEY